MLGGIQVHKRLRQSKEVLLRLPGKELHFRKLSVAVSKGLSGVLMAEPH